MCGPWGLPCEAAADGVRGWAAGGWRRARAQRARVRAARGPAADRGPAARSAPGGPRAGHGQGAGQRQPAGGLEIHGGPQLREVRHCPIMPRPPAPRPPRPPPRGPAGGGPAPPPAPHPRPPDDVGPVSEVPCGPRPRLDGFGPSHGAHISGRRGGRCEDRTMLMYPRATGRRNRQVAADVAVLLAVLPSAWFARQVHETVMELTAISAGMTDGLHRRAGHVGLGGRLGQRRAPGRRQPRRCVPRGLGRHGRQRRPVRPRQSLTRSPIPRASWAW